MLAFALLTLVFGLVLAQSLAGASLEQIRGNWGEHRCVPLAMLAAAWLKPSQDPRSPAAFAAENFSFCVRRVAGTALATAMQPLMQLLVVMADATAGALATVMSLRATAANMARFLNEAVDLFRRRFAATLFELRRTFTRLLDAMGRAQAVALSAVFAGMAGIASIVNGFQFLLKVAFIALMLLVSLVILLFFVLAPSLPLILLVVGIIVSAGVAGTEGMNDAFCVDGRAWLLLAEGKGKPLTEAVVGDVLADGGVVTGVLRFPVASPEAAHSLPLFHLQGVLVSGSHLVVGGDGSSLAPVADHPAAVRCALPPQTLRELVCLQTSTRRMVVAAAPGAPPLHLADWEEVPEGDDATLAAWEAAVAALLRAEVGAAPLAHEGDGALPPTTPICVAGGGVLPLATIVPGMWVADGADFTEVVGTVEVEAAAACGEGRSPVHLRGGLLATPATWVYGPGGRVARAGALAVAASSGAAALPGGLVVWRSLVTRSGSFTVGAAREVRVRDFTEVGLHRLQAVEEEVVLREGGCRPPNPPARLTSRG